jgi:hypothetical protein
MASARMASARRAVAGVVRHGGLVGVLIVGAVIRVAVGRTGVPSVYQDSLIYLRLSKNAPFTFSALRPNGYPVLIRVLSAGTANLRWMTDVQHVAGLVLGVLVYVLLVRLGTRRWLAAVAVAVVVIDAYGVALETDVLSETFFTLTVTASVVLVAATGRGTPALVTSGLLLALAVVTRAVGIFAVPVWVAYVGLLGLGWRRSLVAVAAVVVPLLGYCTFHSVHGGSFALTDGDGWFLYAKVGPIADCSHAHVPPATLPLCHAPTVSNPDFYLFSRASPAQQLFFGPTGDVDVDTAITPASDRLLRDFSLGVIRAHPLAYTRMVSSDVAHYLGPKKAPVELSLYGSPGSLKNRYERYVHVPWWLIPAATAVALAALVTGQARRLEIALLAAMAWALLVGSSATAGFNPRYTIPLVPLFVCAAALSAEVLAAGITHRRTPRPRSQPGEGSATPNVDEHEPGVGVNGAPQAL